MRASLVENSMECWVSMVCRAHNAYIHTESRVILTTTTIIRLKRNTGGNTGYSSEESPNFVPGMFSIRYSK